MSTRRLTLGLALSGVIAAGGAWAGPAWAQSALAQQAADQEKAQQGTTTSSTSAGTAKPAAAKSSGAGTAKPTTTATVGTGATKPATPKSAAAKPAAAKKAPPKPVVYLNDGANAGGTATASAGDSKSGKPQNHEVVKAFEQNCPDVTLTEEKSKAGYDVALEREPGSKGVKTVFGLTNVVHKTNKIEVTSKSGKEVFSESGHSTNQLVKDACAAMAPTTTKVAQK